jgi:tetratricopeptide (TPR) repeat protein
VLVYHDENGDFSVHTEEITVELTGNLDTDVYNMTAELASRMEWWIRKYPEQWFGWLQQPFYTQPVEELEALLQEDPRNTKALYQMGQFHIAHGETAEAEDVLKRSLEADPKFHAAHLALGKIYLEQGNPEGAEKHLSAALELNPKDPGTLKLLGRLFLSLENYNKALEYFQKAIKRKYDDAESYWGKGRCLEKLKGHREAALNYGKGLRSNYDYGPLHEAMIMLAGTSAEYEDQVDEHLLAMEKLRVQPSDELLAVLKKMGREAPHIPK